MKSSHELLKNNRPNGRLLYGVSAVVAGERMPYADYKDPDLPSYYYYGYTGNVEVINLLVWNFFGELIYSAIDYPGIWNDSKLSHLGLYI